MIRLPVFSIVLRPLGTVVGAIFSTSVASFALARNNPLGGSVVELVWFETRRIVAIVAINRGGNVPVIFFVGAPLGIAAVVTGCALIRIHFMRGIMRVAREGCRGESRREPVMTGIAGKRGRDMVIGLSCGR